MAGKYTVSLVGNNMWTPVCVGGSMGVRWEGCDLCVDRQARLQFPTRMETVRPTFKLGLCVGHLSDCAASVKIEGLLWETASFYNTSTREGRNLGGKIGCIVKAVA